MCIADVQKRVPSSAVDQAGSKVHRWSRASATARAAKNKLGMLCWVSATSVVEFWVNWSLTDCTNITSCQWLQLCAMKLLVLECYWNWTLLYFAFQIMSNVGNVCG